MNGISGLENIAGSAVQSTSNGPTRDELGQEAFLQLMIAQFRNQDPFEPMTNGEFLGQLAQFSTVSGINELQSTFDGLANALQSDQALQATNLVGHRVLVRSDRASFANGEAVDGAVALDGAVSALDIEITNGAGELVRTLSLGPQDAGLARFSWDGVDSGGEPVADGNYSIAARVVQGDRPGTVATLVETQIESVSLDQYGGGITLNTAGQGALRFSQVERIL